jgi:hypothetical protein
MKQYKITTDNINKDSADDCVLDPNDPIREIKQMQYLAGLGNAATMTNYEGSNISVTGNEKVELMKKHNIKPGTPEWFRLWFTLPYLTNTDPLDPKFNKN